LKFQELDGIPVASGIDCLCNNPKGCGYYCHSGNPCEKFKPNFKFEKMKEAEINPAGIDYEKDYFKPQKSDLELKIEKLEEKILELESKITPIKEKEVK